MKKLFCLLIFAGLLYSIEIGGSGEINNFYYIFSTDSIKPVPYMFHQFKIDLSQTSENYDFTGSLLFRLWTQKSAFSLSELSNPSFKVKPHIWELYLNIYGFIFDNLDLRIGKQRISWGTADKLNPTDVLNPYDLQNPFDFGKKMPSEAVVFDLYLPREFAIEGIFLPRFVPPLLPEGYFPLSGNLEYFYFLQDMEDTIVYPESKDFKNSMFGGKIYGKLFKWDFSLSYFYGFDNFPVMKDIAIYMDTMLQDTIKKVIYFFPSIHMIGFDFAGELKSVGIWGEIGYFIPKDTVLFPSWVTCPWDTLLSTPYLKSTFGFDYTFKNGIYINTQWNHGFFFERYSPDIPYSLHDYFISRLEKKFLREKLKIGFAGILEIANWDFPGDNYSYSIIPEISYRPHDNVEINAGFITLHGKGQSLLGSWKNFDQFYLNLKVEF